MSNKACSVFLVISAPSGGGKTTVMRSLLSRQSKLRRAVTCTTRAPRGEERDGEDYYFLAADVFESKVRAGEFLEHATVYGNRYGTLAAEVLFRLGAGLDVVLSVDVQGVRSIQEMSKRDAVLGKSLVTVFLTPGDPAELERRLRGRGEDSGHALDRRLGMAREEVACWPSFDYLVVSGSMEEDSARVEGILEAERLRTNRVGSLAGWE